MQNIGCVLLSVLAATLFPSDSRLFGQETELISKAETAFFEKVGLKSKLEAVDSKRKAEVLSDWLLGDKHNRDHLAVLSVEYMVASNREHAIESEAFDGGGSEGDALLLVHRVPWVNRYTRISFRLVAVAKAKATEVVVINRVFSNEGGDWIEADKKRRR